MVRKVQGFLKSIVMDALASYWRRLGYGNERVKTRGVFHQPSGRFKASLRVNGKDIYLGQYACEELACQAYDRFAIKVHGVDGDHRLNFGIVWYKDDIPLIEKTSLTRGHGVTDVLGAASAGDPRGCKDSEQAGHYLAKDTEEQPLHAAAPGKYQHSPAQDLLERAHAAHWASGQDRAAALWVQQCPRRCVGSAGHAHSLRRACPSVSYEPERYPSGPNPTQRLQHVGKRDPEPQPDFPSRDLSYVLSSDAALLHLSPTGVKQQQQHPVAIGVWRTSANGSAHAESSTIKQSQPGGGPKIQIGRGRYRKRSFLRQAAANFVHVRKSTGALWNCKGVEHNVYKDPKLSKHVRKHAVGGLVDSGAAVNTQSSPRPMTRSDCKLTPILVSSALPPRCCIRNMEARVELHRVMGLGLGWPPRSLPWPRAG
eukprot:scaffold1410_cov386-Prasinococcus_capsulatus_cf.AAC.7